MTRSRARSASCRRRRGRSGCTSAARPCTRASMSATRGPTILGTWLKRWLAMRGYETKLVINITDINDKIYDAAPGCEREARKRRDSLVPRGHRRLGLGMPDVQPTAADTVPTDRADRAVARARRRVRGRRRRLLPCLALRRATESCAARSPTRSRSRSRTRERRIRATSRCGRRTSRARTRGGSHRGAAAARAGTSSARR